MTAASTSSFDLIACPADMDGICSEITAHSSIQARAIIDGAEQLFLRAAGGTDMAIATVTRGGLRSSMILSAKDQLWPLSDALHALCDRLGVTELTIESIKGLASGDAAHPSLAQAKTSYVNERLYFINLQQAPQDSAYSSNTRRNIAKAKRAGVTVALAHDPASLQAHLALTDSSVARRESRGESVALRGSRERSARFLANMQATLFQAQLGDQIISSNLVFFQGKNAYYYDGGSSPEGMSLGASHFLMHTIINKLHADGYRNLNLGIARAGNDGLIRFKEGFAAELRFVDRATYDRDRLGLRAVNLLRRLRKEAGRRLKPA